MRAETGQGGEYYICYRCRKTVSPWDNKYRDVTFNRLAIALFSVVVLFTGCQSASNTAAKRTIRARVTFYHPHEDHYGSRIAMTKRFRAQEGRTMAAPKVLPFQTHVVVPQLNGIVGDGSFNIEDRGGALERYYRRGQLRLDVYVASRRKMRRLEYGMPEYMEVVIE